MKLQVGQYVVAYGYKVKNDNDIYIVKAAYESGSYCLYKVKMNGEETKTKYRILFINPKDFTNQELTIRILDGVEDLKAAKKEVNEFINGVEAKEVVVSYTETDKAEITNKCIIQVVKSIPTTKSIYNMPKGFYKVEILNNNRVMMKRLGKKGQVLSSLTGTYNTIVFSEKTVNEFLKDGYFVLVDEHRTTKGELQQIEQVEEVEEQEAVVAEEQVVELTEEVKANTTIPVKTITYKWCEANRIIKDNTIVNTFADANKLVTRVASNMSANKEQGYTKTAFLIEWVDGRTHEGRIDIQAKHMYNSNAIGEHVKYFYEGLAGLRKPMSWSVEQYESHLKSVYGIDEAGKEEVKNILNTYLLADILPNPDPERESMPEPTECQFKNVEQFDNVVYENTNKAADNVITTFHNVNVSLNNDKNGIEIRFVNKPNGSVIESLRANGFRWSNYNKVWYAKQSTEKLKFAQSLGGMVEEIESTNETQTDNTDYNSNVNIMQGNSTFEYPEINIDDIHTYIVDEKLQKAEHDANWIFRKNEKDRTHEIQSIIQHWQDRVLEVVNSTDNQRVIYYLKKALQSFKRKQYDNFVSCLRNKAAYPSMAVAGPANHNNNKANKLHNRYDKLIQESIELDEYMKKAINRAKRDLKNIEKEKIQKQVEQTSIDDVQFETVTQEADIYGHVKKFRFYKYGDYMITKAWGCYRVFKNGKEVNVDLKTTDTLETAKRHVVMLTQAVTV